jgi:hypothetical protein
LVSSYLLVFAGDRRDLLKGFEFILFAFWLIPVLLLCATVYGYIRTRLCFNQNRVTKKIIIQITTVENFNLVNKIIETVRDYRLDFPHEIWVVTESQFLHMYQGADRLFRVPIHFRSVGNYKVRALDYSTQIRNQLEMTTDEYKVLFLDDDTIPSRKYIEKCFIGDYDIMEGIIEPRLNYGNRYSYVDNIRTLSCISLCSIFQSHGYPLWVHGEGMCIKASAERDVGWRFDIIGSEDLIFGHICGTKKLKWGFIWETIYITSPWTFKDFIKQRKRWLWGNIDAISRILTWKSGVRIIFFYLIGAAAILISSIGFIMDQLGMLEFTIFERSLSYISLVVWIGLYAYIGFKIGGGKWRHVILSVILAWYVSVMNTIPIWIGVFLGRPKKFEVIAKEPSDS